MKKPISCLCFLLLSGCVTEQHKLTHLSDSDEPSLHSVQSSRLKELMRELDDLMFERMLNEVQIDRQRRFRIEEMIKVTDKMLNTVKSIPDTLHGLDLSENERLLFLDLSQQLRMQLTLLKNEAEQRNVDNIPKQANQIIETCNTCHHIFRQDKLQ